MIGAVAPSWLGAFIELFSRAAGAGAGRERAEENEDDELAEARRATAQIQPDPLRCKPRPVTRGCPMPDDRPPLRLPYDPDEYLCTWAVPDGAGGFVELSGSLTVAGNQSPHGTVHGELPMEETERAPDVSEIEFPQRHFVPVLHGVLANGGTVFLINAHLVYWHDGQGQVYATAALLSKPRFFGFVKPKASNLALTEVLVTEMDLQICALDAAMGVAPIVKARNPTTHPDNPKDEWTAILNEDPKLRWEEDGVALEVGYDGKMRTGDPYESVLAWSPRATFEFPAPVLLQRAIDDYLEPLRNVLSVATGKSQPTTYLAVKVDGEDGWWQVFGSRCSQNPYQSTLQAVREAKCVISAKKDELSLLHLTHEWARLMDSHHPLTETFGSMLHATDQHPRSRYLLLIQALEGMYGHDTKDAYAERAATHMEKYLAAKEAAKEHLDPETFKFVKNNLSRNPISTLEDALKAMTTSLPTDVMPRLDASALVGEVMQDPKKPQNTLSALRVARNNLAHGTRGYAEANLRPVVEVLEQVVRAHALRIIGCEDEVLTRALSAPD